MTARRSEDPAARDHADGVGSAAEYWTAHRRHAARPVPFERELSPDSLRATQRTEAESGEPEPRATKGDATCGGGSEAGERGHDR